MPCYLTPCDPAEEAKRFGAAFVGLYAYHFVWDKLIITPLTNWFVSSKMITKDKRDKMRESLWKNASVGTFTALGLYIASGEDWWMNPHGYFKGWPTISPESIRWHYMLYISFWLQSVDFMLNLTNKHYIVKRKDNAEMLLHHFATITLMIFSYIFDITQVGLCVLMIHEVNDLLLETAKVFVYLEWELPANIFFGTFALMWFVVRWGVFGYNILWPVYTIAFDDIIVPIQQKGSYMDMPAVTWWWFWCIFLMFLCILFVLHIFWGVLIVKMVAKTLQDGNVEKDIRSDSEPEDDDKENKKAAEPTKPTPAATATTNGDAKPKPRRRAPKAE